MTEQPRAKFQSEIDLENKYQVALTALLSIYGDGSYKDIASQFAHEALEKLNELPKKSAAITDGEVASTFDKIGNNDQRVKHKPMGFHTSEEVRADECCVQSPS